MDTNPAEFQRQLRSVFAVLRTLVRQTIQGRASVEDYAGRLESRIGALARVHEMLMRTPAEGVDLQEIVGAELLSQAVAEQQCRIEGPEIRIARESATSLALAFHELALNALDHGALAHADGRIEVIWTPLQQDGADWLQIVWDEHQVPQDITPPKGKGFGWELIERMLPYELSAQTHLEYRADGIRVQLLIPALAGARNWITAGEF